MDDSFYLRKKKRDIEVYGIICVGNNLGSKFILFDVISGWSSVVLFEGWKKVKIFISI